MGCLKVSVETERQNALDIGDGPSYFDLCNQLGIQGENIEDSRLYDIGRQLQFDFSGGLEKVAAEEEITPISKKRKRIVRHETYVAFLDEAKKISPRNLSGMKRKLFKYFNYSFGPYGKTPLRNMSDSQVMGTFYGVVRSAKRMMDEENK